MTAFFLTLISLFFLIITLKLLFYTTRFKNLPPGPPFLPIIGNLHQLKKPIHHTFQTLSQKHGQIFSLWLGSRLVVVVSSLKTAQEFFTKHDIVLANRPQFLFGKYINYNYTTLIQASYGDHWRNLRRIITTEVLSSNRLNSFLEIRRDEIMRLIQKLASVSYHDFSEVELAPMFSELTFNTVMRMMSGKRYYGDDCDVSDVEEARLFREIMKEILSLGGATNISDFLGFLRWFDFDGLEKSLKRISKRADSFLQRLIDEHRFEKRTTNTMLDHLLKQQQSQPEYYTDQIIKGLIMPERFEKEGETNKLLSFGMGRRACPGENLAHRTMSVTLGLLIQCFEWKRIGKDKIDMGEKKGVTLEKEISLKAMCKLRHPMKIKNAF
ncbi:hypothetical protein RYX36_021457 [Vicia faba]